MEEITGERVLTGYISRYSGFCFGVRLAVESAYCESGTGKLCMYGEVVHNPFVVEKILENNRVCVANNFEEVLSFSPSKVLIRAHGVSECTIKSLERSGIEVVDRTCPKVKRVQNIVFKAREDGKKIVIVGDPAHPEVIGINGWCGSSAFVIKNINQAENVIHNFSDKDVFCMVSQTTFNYEKYLEIYDFFSSHLENIEFHNTICNDTQNRQNEIESLSKKVDMMIVVGGKNSSNSNRLFEIAKIRCRHVQHIEDERDMDFSNWNLISSFAVCSGSSTPIELVDNVVNKIKSHNDAHDMRTNIINLGSGYIYN